MIDLLIQSPQDFVRDIFKDPNVKSLIVDDEKYA